MEMSFWSIISSISLGILLLIVTKLWEPIAAYVGYPFDGRRRVKDLVDEVVSLCAVRDDLLHLDPNLSSKKRGDEWKKRVEDLCARKEEIKTGYDGCGPQDYFNKCYFARQADIELKKATAEIKTGEDLLKEAKASPHPVPDPLLQDRRPKQLWGMDPYMQKVRAFIEDNSSTHQSGSLGIWGMAGVGKTCLLKSVRDYSLRTRSFDHVLLIRAGRGATVGTMQKAIAAGMGLTSKTDDETSQEGVIYNQLRGKSFLLLIDDLWERHDLERVGIPMPLGNVQCLPHVGGLVQEYQRKVVFTTRSHDVCGQMECAHNAIRMECLSQDDAWKLFVDKMGNGNKIIDDPKLQKLARKLVDECSGLPMALCTIGRAMSTRRDPKEWICASDLIKDSKLLEIKMDKDLINSVQSSYDHMEDDLKNCFLICLLWPRGENIPKDKLVKWWTGLGFVDVTNAINRGCMIINDLMRASMLEKGNTNRCSSENSHVKLHEVTREMALWIVKDSVLPHSFCRSALPEEKWKTVQKAWISAGDSSGWTSSLSCPQLTMLVTYHPFSFEAKTCFQSLTFLDLNGKKGTKMHEFPTAVCSLQALQYLNLSATTIGALPNDLQKLSNLKYLYIRETGTLQTVPNELISHLAKLRVLDLFCSGTNSNKGQDFSSLIKGFPREKIDLILGISVHTEQDIMKLIGLKEVVHTQALCMHHFEVPILKLELLGHMEKLRELTITNSPDTESLVAKEQPTDKDGLLPNLEFLKLSSLHKLQKVTWNNAGQMIRVITIYNCSKLRDVTWVRCLEKLEELTIANCPELKQVIGNDAEPRQDMVGANQVKIFGQLKKLYLEQLPELSIISERSLPFEELSYVFVSRCEKLKIIRVEQRRNHNKIKIDCNEDWWTSLGENQGTMSLHFDPTLGL